MPLFAHVGLGLATKRIAPQVPLWALVASALGPDILAVFFTVIGFQERWIHHGLFMNIVWAILAMLVTAGIMTIQHSKKSQTELPEKAELPQQEAVKKSILFTSLIIGLLFFSHWILDFIGWPLAILDPNYPGIPLLFDDAQQTGLGVYRTWTGALIMEIGFLAFGLVVYLLFRKNLKQETR